MPFRKKKKKHTILPPTPPTKKKKQQQQKNQKKKTKKNKWSLTRVELSDNKKDGVEIDTSEEKIDVGQPRSAEEWAKWWRWEVAPEAGYGEDQKVVRFSNFITILPFFFSRFNFYLF